MKTECLSPHWQDLPFVPDMTQITQSTYPKQISLRFTLTLFFPLRPSPRWSHSLSSPHQNPVCTSLSPIPVTYTAHLVLLGYDHRNNIWWGVQITKLPLCGLLHYPITSSILGPIVSLSNLLCGTPSAHVLPSVKETKFRAYTQLQEKL